MGRTPRRGHISGQVFSSQHPFVPTPSAPSHREYGALSGTNKLCVILGELFDISVALKSERVLLCSDSNSSRAFTSPCLGAHVSFSSIYHE